MLLASLGLHGLFLMLPTGASDEAMIPPPDPEQDSVAITRVPPATVAEQPPTLLGGPSGVGNPLPAQALPRLAQPLVPQPQPTGGRPTANGAVRSQGNRPASQTNPGANPLEVGARPPASGNTQAVAPTPPSTPPPPSRPLFDSGLGERLMAYAAALSLPQPQVDRLKVSVQRRFGYTAAATTRDAYSTNLSAWESTIQGETGIEDLSAEVDRSHFSVTYPQRVCLANEPGEVRLGVVVNPDGSQRGEPVVLRSSGYAAVDQKALELLRDHTFSEAEGIKAYTVSVATKVDYGLRPCLEAKPQS
ncbi:MAG TPA: TonB family protein [Leptolyngbyaceae cyanobacterium M65_K2018_010]|nr:TonB family protein [Leptolyngbyaceae cyanobacterium M65_K2018_010]